jgi:hypothetical protein
MLGKVPDTPRPDKILILLLDDPALHASSVVANNAMNRERQLNSPRDLDLPYDYLGADDRAGANYTGQPTVHSYYRSRAGRT